MLARGVTFAEVPREETYGHVVVFFDLYGNKWDLLEQRGEWRAFSRTGTPEFAHSFSLKGLSYKGLSG